MTLEDHYTTLMRHLGYWSWVHIIYQYDETHLLIADEWFIDQIRSARPAVLKCNVTRPENYQEAITDNIKKVLVFCEQKEVRIVRDVLAAHPKMHVASGTYGYACTGRDRYPRMKQYKPADGGKKATPVVLLSTPYADAEFIAEVMFENGFPFACEFLGRPFASLLKTHKNFQVSRFYNTVEDYYTVGGKLFYLAQTDVLESLFENTPYSLERFIAYLQKFKAKVIIVQRNNTILQAAFAQLLHRTTERSVWTKKASKKILSKAKPEDFLGSLEWGEQIERGVQMLDKIAGASVDCMQVSLEDFSRDQGTQLKKISDFVGVDLKEELTELDYKSNFESAPDMYPLGLEYQHELIDRLGLHAVLK